MVRLSTASDHCHWTYSTSASYRSFWRWPTRADVEAHVAELDSVDEREYTPVQLHGTRCTNPAEQHD